MNRGPHSRQVSAPSLTRTPALTAGAPKGIRTSGAL